MALDKRWRYCQIGKVNKVIFWVLFIWSFYLIAQGEKTTISQFYSLKSLIIMQEGATKMNFTYIENHVM